MGRLINGINGPFIGKVGSVVGSSRKGNPYIKGLPKKRTKNISDKELANRKRFAVAQSWLRPLTVYVRAGFKGYTATAEGFIAAKSYLLHHAMVLEDGNFKVLSPQMKVSFGTLALPSSFEVVQSTANELTFTWDTACPKGTSAFDQAMPLAYDPTSEHACFEITGNFRKDGSMTLRVDATPGTVYQVYLAFCAADRQSQSDSIYLGEVEMLAI